MELYNEPNVKQEHKLLKIIIFTTFIATFLGAIFFFAGNFLPSTKIKAATANVYFMSGDINSGTNTGIMNGAVSGDTIKITGTLDINATNSKLKSKNVIILIKGGNMQWTGRYTFSLGASAKVFVTNGGKLSTDKTTYGGDPAIFFNSIKTVSYDGTGASYSFSDVNTNGGVSAAGVTPLPVKLISFESVLDNGKVILNWATATEINNDRFEIERSNDGKTWKVVGTVKGNGNSSSIIDYTYTDNPGLLSGNIYYRLHQIDFNGETEYGPISVVHNNKKENVGKVYPNPANSQINISLQSDNYQLSILDQSGKLMVSKQIDTDLATIDSKEFPSGIYFVKLENNTISENHKLVVKH